MAAILVTFAPPFRTARTLKPSSNKSVVANRRPEVYDVPGISVKLSFLPGELHLSEEHGVFVIQVQDKEILRTGSKRTALSKFNDLRRSMEQQFPTREVTPEEKRELLKGILNEARLDGVGRRLPKKRSTARSTRTFGG